MATLKKYNLEGKAVGDVEVADALFEKKTDSQLIKDYIVALRNNVRQRSANTKGRSEVSHSNKKPHKQKGTGNARQGSLAAPQYRGGGIVFGPKPICPKPTRINTKERRSAIRHLLGEKIEAERLIVVEDGAFEKSLDKPSTKRLAAFLKLREVLGRRVLFVGKGEMDGGQSTSVRGKFENIQKSTRNLPRTAFTLALNVNGYDLIASHALVITESGLNEMVELLSPKG